MSVLTADGFDDAIIGIGRRCGQLDIVAYGEQGDRHPYEARENEL